MTFRRPCRSRAWSDLYLQCHDWKRRGSPRLLLRLDCTCRM